MLKYQVYLISLFVIILSINVLAEVRINEIMYNPKDSIQCSDSSCEWIELYNDGNEIINLSRWKLNGNNFDDAVISPKSYVIIARKLIDLNGGQSFEFLWGNNNGIWDSLDGNYAAVDGNFILNNNGGTIILTDSNNETISDVTYSNKLANGNGYTIEFYNGNRYESASIGGTPGYENSIKEIPAIQENKTEVPVAETVQNTSEQDSIIEIKEITPATIRFGDNVSVKVDVYRGSTAKYAVYFYIEKDNKTITDKISEHASKKYQNYTFNYSVQLKSNCDNKYEEGKYYIIVEGLEKSISEEIEITNPDSCAPSEGEPIELPIDNQKTKTNINKSILITESNINQASPITGNIVYESSDIKAERLALYLFCFILILLVIYLIKRNKDGN